MQPYQHKKTVFSKKIKNNWIILGKKKKFAHKLNNTAGFVWQLLEKPVSIPQIAKKLQQEFDIDSKTAEKDTKKLIKQFLKSDFIEKFSQ